MVIALNTGVVGGGVTSSRADEFTQIETGVSELRGGNRHTLGIIFHDAA